MSNACISRYLNNLCHNNITMLFECRFSFAADISRGMQYLHSHKLYHGRLTSNNSVVDERWAVKITGNFFSITTKHFYSCTDIGLTYKEIDSRWQ